MAVSKAQAKATQKYESKNYFRALVRFKKEDESRIKNALGDNSLNNFIVTAVMEKVQRAEAQQATVELNAAKLDAPTPKADPPEDVAALNNWLHQIQEENEQKRLQEVARRQANVEAENGYD